MLTARSINSTLDRMLSLDRVLDEALASSWNGSAGRVWIPALDVAERKDAYVIAVELPGVDPATIDLNFEQNVLTIRGTKPLGFDAGKEEDLRVHAAERVSGAFERSIRLPKFVDGDNIHAEFMHGVLRLTVPKGKAAQPRRIPIAGIDPKQIGE